MNVSSFPNNTNYTIKSIYSISSSVSICCCHLSTVMFKGSWFLTCTIPTDHKIKIYLRHTGFTQYKLLLHHPFTQAKRLDCIVRGLATIDKEGQTFIHRWGNQGHTSALASTRVKSASPSFRPGQKMRLYCQRSCHNR